ncbi:hypothetical protein ACFX19_027570 [Malus domestica]
METKARVLFGVFLGLAFVLSSSLVGGIKGSDGIDGGIAAISNATTTAVHKLTTSSGDEGLDKSKNYQNGGGSGGGGGGGGGGNGGHGGGSGGGAGGGSGGAGGAGKGKGKGIGHKRRHGKGKGKGGAVEVVGLGVVAAIRNQLEAGKETLEEMQMGWPFTLHGPSTL